MNSTSTVAIVLHGGAGDRDRKTISKELEHALSSGIEQATEAGYKVLREGGSSIEAIEQAIMIMETLPCFNAGIGAALTEDGEVELDAAIMDGNTRMAGAVAGVARIKSPIQAARVVMEKSPHVVLIGRGAERYAEKHGLEMVPPEYFITQENRRMLSSIIEETQKQKELAATGEKVMLGTVGAVALDKHGNLAAANSTGGIMKKMSGRVGDTPIIGGGTYALNNVAAIAATGYGEYFIRTVAAHEILSQMRYCQTSLEDACNNVLQDISSLGGRGGIVAIDAHGNIAMPFTTSSMVRAAISSAGFKSVEIW